MSTGFGLMIESLVAVLLLVTIGYCVVLNGRLKRLKADEQALHEVSLADDGLGNLRLDRLDGGVHGGDLLIYFCEFRSH